MVATSALDDIVLSTDKTASSTETQTQSVVATTTAVTPVVKVVAVTTKETAQTACSIPAGTLLKKGVKDGKNKYVTKLQNFLSKNGYIKAVPNGYFGVATHNGVKTLQKEYGYLVTGIVGPYTLAKINEVNCGPKNNIETVATKNTDTAITIKENPNTIVTSTPVEASTGDSADKPKIVSFSIVPTQTGDQYYNAKIVNADTVSLKATCPTGIVEVKTLVGLTKTKVSDQDSVCKKEKYLLLNDANQGLLFERNQSQILFIDRDSVPSWFAYDASSTPTNSSLPVTVKACFQAICVQKVVTVQVNDFYKKTASKELSLTDVKVDSAQNIFLSAYNFNHLTIKAGCPYNTQAIDSAGAVIAETSSPCNVEKDIVADQTTITTAYEKAEGTPLKNFGFNFELKLVNGQIDAYSNIELVVKACTGVQAETISSTTLRCVAKTTYLPIYPKITGSQSSSTATQ